MHNAGKHEAAGLLGFAASWRLCAEAVVRYGIWQWLWACVVPGPGMHPASGVTGRVPGVPGSIS